MTPLTPSRVPLLLETTKVTKPACSAAKIRGRTAFCRGEAPDWAFWLASATVSSGKIRSIELYLIDRLRAKFDRSTFEDFRISKHFHMKFCHSSLIDLQNTKTSQNIRNNKAKGLTSVNLGVQIHNIWHSSIPNRVFSFPDKEEAFKILVNVAPTKHRKS
jgi:hypothetical protein